MARQRLRTVSTAVIVALLTVSLLLAPQSMQQGPVRSELTVIIPRSVIGARDIQVQWATLTIPGVGIVPGEARVSESEVRIVFSLGRLAGEASSIDSRAGIATATILLVDYSNGTRYAVTLTSSNYAAYILLGMADDTQSLLRMARRLASYDPVLLLRAGEIVVDRAYASILRLAGDIGALGYAPAQRADCGLPAVSAFGWSGEGVGRIVDQEMLDRILSQGPPEWWKAHYIDTPEGMSAGEAYAWLAERLLASVYVVSKHHYPTPGEAVLAARRAALPVGGDELGMVPMSILVAPDRWENSSVGAESVSLPLASLAATLQYGSRTGLDISGLLIVAGVPMGVHSGLYYMGAPVSLAVNKTSLSRDIGAYIRSGEAATLTLYADNARITTGPDVLLIAWNVEACDAYYLVRPVPTIAPLYAVDLGVARLSTTPESRAAPMLAPSWEEYKRIRDCPDDYIVGVETRIERPDKPESITYEPGLDTPPLALGPHRPGDADPLAVNYARYASTLLVSPSFPGDAALVQWRVEAVRGCNSLVVWRAVAQARQALGGEPASAFLAVTGR